MSGAVPPPAARPLERAAGVPRPVCPGCGRCVSGDPAPAPQRVPLRAGVARCGGSRRTSPGGVAFPHCEGRLVSGVVPPPAIDPLERAARVPRPVCPGCGRCGRGDPAKVSQRAPLRAGVARRGARRKGVPGGGAFHRCEGRPVSGAVPPLAARPLERAARVPRPVCPGCGRRRRGDPAPVSQRAPLRAGVARCGSGRRASPGGVAFHRCEGRPVSGAVPPSAARPLERAARVPRPVCPGCGRCGRGDSAPAPQRAPLRAGVARCGGGGRTSPGGSPSTIVRGVWCQALSLPRPSVLWSGQPGFRVPGVPGAVGAGVWTLHRSHSACALAGWRCPPWGWRKGVPGRVAFHRCEGRPVSGAVPPLAARPLERAARVPRPACPRCGRCGRGDSAPAPQRAPLRAGVPRCGCGGRASPGGVPSTVVRGAWCQALSLPRPPVLWSGRPGFRVPCVPDAVGAGVGTHHRAHSVRPCRLALLAVRVGEGRPRGACLPPL